MRVLLLFLILSGCAGIDNVSKEEPSKPVEIAERYVGLNQYTHRRELKEFLGVDPVRIEWCAAFVNSVLGEAGIQGTDSLVARDFLRWGVKTRSPERGSLVIYSRGTEAWQGHVGFFIEEVEVDGRLFWAILGGNQDSGVTIELFPRRSPRLLGIRNPVHLDVAL
jgi:uncharacterized protein (TIGR02594 family)